MYHAAIERANLEMVKAWNEFPNLCGHLDESMNDYTRTSIARRKENIFVHGKYQLVDIAKRGTNERRKNDDREAIDWDTVLCALLQIFWRATFQCQTVPVARCTTGVGVGNGDACQQKGVSQMRETIDNKVLHDNDI